MDDDLQDLAVCAREKGLLTLVEVHDEEELERALALEPDAVGVNARDLRDFSIDLATVETLLPRIPTGILRVAESGLHGVEASSACAPPGPTLRRWTALMRAEDPARTLREWGRPCDDDRAACGPPTRSRTPSRRAPTWWAPSTTDIPAAPHLGRDRPLLASTGYMSGRRDGRP